MHPDDQLLVIMGWEWHIGEMWGAASVGRAEVESEVYSGYDFWYGKPVRH